MNYQDLGYLRENVSRALADISGTTKGQLDAFQGAALVKTSCFKRNRMRDATGAIRESDPVKCAETRASKSPMPPIEEITFRFSSWRRAINTLTDEQQSWIMYQYGNDLNFEHQVNICQYVWIKIEVYADKSNLSKKVKERLRSLVWLSVQQYHSADYSQTKLAELAGVSRYNWNKTYDMHWREMINISDELDKLALISMYCARQKQRRNNIVENLQKLTK